MEDGAFAEVADQQSIYWDQSEWLWSAAASGIPQLQHAVRVGEPVWRISCSIECVGGTPRESWTYAAYDADDQLEAGALRDFVVGGRALSLETAYHR